MILWSALLKYNSNNAGNAGGRSWTGVRPNVDESSEVSPGAGSQEQAHVVQWTRYSDTHARGFIQLRRGTKGSKN